MEAGKEYVVTQNGISVARIIPERLPDRSRRLTPVQQEALERSVAWLRRGWDLGIDHIDREALYGDARGGKSSA